MTRLLPLALGALLLLPSSCGAPGAVDECETDRVLAAIRGRLAEIRDYQTVAHVSLGEERLVSRIAGRVPDRLRLSLEMPRPGGTLVETAVFDGRYQWVESRSGANASVVRVALSEVTRSGRPFDTSLYLMGSGLLNGEGYPETFATLVSVYDLSATCSDSTVVLAGPVDRQAFERFARGRRSHDEASVDRFVEEFGHLRIEFEAESYAAQRYELGPGPAKPTLAVDFSATRLNEGLAADTFEYTPPAGVEVEDIADALRPDDG